MLVNKLVRELQQGSEEAFSELYMLYEKSLLNHLYKMLGNHEEAEEVFHETMLNMIKKIDSYTERTDLKNSFKAWLFRMATNKAIDKIRTHKKHIQFDVVESISIEDEIIHYDLNEKLSSLIMHLPRIQRTFLNLKVKEDLSHLEIATICGCSLNSVKQGLFRARKNLKDLMIKEEIEI